MRSGPKSIAVHKKTLPHTHQGSGPEGNGPEGNQTQTPDQNQEEVDPVDQEFAGTTEKLEAQIAAHREHLTRLKADEADPEIISEAEQRLDAVTRLRGVINLIKSQQREIGQREIGAESVTSDMGRRDQHLSRLNRDRATVEALIRQTDTLDAEELIQRIDQVEADSLAARAAEEGEAATTTPPKGNGPEGNGPKGNGSKGDGPEGNEPDQQTAEARPADGEAAATATPESGEMAPEAAMLPEAQAGTTIPYRDDSQRDLILSKLAMVDMAESDLADMIANGRVPLGKRGRLTNQSIKEINAIIDNIKAERELNQPVTHPDAPESDPVANTGTNTGTNTGIEPTSGETPAVTVQLSDELRGEALFAGLDYRNVIPSNKGSAKTPKNGRLTKRNIRSAIAKRGDTEPDAYAMTARNDLDEILEMLKGVSDELESNEHLMHQAIRILSEDKGSNPDDLVALYAHLRNMADAEDQITNASMKPLTKTETKNIKRMQRQIIKAHGLSDDAAESIARAKIMAQRGQDKTPVKGTGDRIAASHQLTTAGRNKLGRIQSYLKSGTRIRKRVLTTPLLAKIKFARTNLALRRHLLRPDLGMAQTLFLTCLKVLKM